MISNLKCLFSLLAGRLGYWLGWGGFENVGKNARLAKSWMVTDHFELLLEFFSVLSAVPARNSLPEVNKNSVERSYHSF